jgi:predicted aminopeptidase
VPGCSVGYVAHVSLGQMRLLLDRERLTDERIAALSPEERAGLDTLRRARALGESLGLARSTSYRHLVERGPDRAVRVVVAAPPERLEPRTWWFPIVGRIAYRGYFDPERAKSFADGLRAEGLDVYVRPAELYSTLGYFDDPFPRSGLLWSPVDLADTGIHELVHETIFVAGDSAYDEALASFIAERATLELFRDQPALADEALRVFADRQTFANLIDALARELEALYAHTASREDALRERQAVFERYQNDVFPNAPWQTDRFKGVGGIALSNAFVLAQRTYLGDLPCFERELSALGGDLRTFIAAHREKPGRRPDCPATPQ